PDRRRRLPRARARAPSPSPDPTSAAAARSTDPEGNERQARRQPRGIAGVASAPRLLRLDIELRDVALHDLRQLDLTARRDREGGRPRDPAGAVLPTRWAPPAVAARVHARPRTIPLVADRVAPLEVVHRRLLRARLELAGLGIDDELAAADDRLGLAEHE